MGMALRHAHYEAQDATNRKRPESHTARGVSHARQRSRPPKVKPQRQGSGANRGGHMALADRIAAPEYATHGKPCSVGVLLDTLEGDELAALEKILADRDWSQAMVWKALTDEGYEVGMQSINRHRGGKCRCARERQA